MARLFAFGALGLLLLLAGAAYLLIVRPSALAQYVTGKALPRVSSALGRPVTVGQVRARVFPNPSVELHQVKVAGAAGEPALLEAPEVEVSIALWPLLRSLGEEVELSRIHLKDAQAALVRRVDGTWSYEDLGGKDDAQPQAPSSRSFHVDAFDITNAKVELLDSAAGRHASVPLSNVTVHAQDVELGQPLRVDFSAVVGNAGRKEASNVTGRLELSKLPASKAALEAEGYPAAEGTLALHGLSLETFRDYFPAKLATLVRGGTLELSARLSTPVEGARRYLVEGKGQLTALQLRGGAAEGALSFSAKVDPANPKGAVLAVRDLTLSGPGTQVGGSVDATLEPMAAKFALRGGQLDLDQLLGVFPEKPEPERAAEEPLLTSSQRAELGEVRVSGTLALAQVQRGKLTAEELKANVALERGVLTVKQGSAKLYGGSVKLDGTRVDLTPREPRWTLAAQLQGMQLGEAFTALSSGAPLQGRVSANLGLSGQGQAWEQIREQVTGAGSLKLENGELTTTDLGEKLAGALAAGLQRLGRGGAAEGVARVGQGTAIQALQATFTVKDGWLQLRQPLAVSGGFGTLSLDGRIGLDQRLDLTGKALLQPEFVAKALRGAVSPKAPIEVPVKLGGTLKAPALAGVDAGALARSALRLENAPAPVQQKAKQVEEELRNQARRGLGGILDGLRK